MKTQILNRITTSGIGFSALLLLASTSYAGPGLEFWKNLVRPKTVAPKVAAAEIAAACPGSEAVPVYVMRQSWVNQRGPLARYQVGTNQVCKICPVTTYETTYLLPNRKGPARRVAVTKTGIAHTCDENCVKNPKG